MINFMERLWQFIWLILSGLFLIGIGLWGSASHFAYIQREKLQERWQCIKIFRRKT